MAINSQKVDGSPAVVQDEYAQQRPRRRGLKGHCARCWWLYLIIVIIIILLVVLLVIFVGIPHIAQQNINNAVMTVQGITVLNTQTDNYTMSINGTITSSYSGSATIDGFVGNMYLEDLQPQTPFAAVQFPSVDVASTITVNISSQFINITDMNAFTVFNTWLLLNETLNVTLSGDTNIHVGGISKAFPITFTKTVNMPGLRNFVGTNVTQSAISLTPDSQGDDFTGFVSIPNYSLVTFDIGNASFYNYFNNTVIGTTYIDNILLVAGQSNNFSMRSNITQAPVLTALGAQPYCSNGGVLPFQLSGKNVTNNGQYLPYYALALAATNQTIEIGIGDDLKKLNVTIPCASS